MFYLYYFRAVLKLFPFFVLKIYISDIFSRTINLLNFRKDLVRSLKIGKCFLIYYYYYFYFILKSRRQGMNLRIS